MSEFKLKKTFNLSKPNGKLFSLKNYWNCETILKWFRVHLYFSKLLFYFKLHKEIENPKIFYFSFQIFTNLISLEQVMLIPYLSYFYLFYYHNNLHTNLQLCFNFPKFFPEDQNSFFSKKLKIEPILFPQSLLSNHMSILLIQHMHKLSIMVFWC